MAAFASESRDLRSIRTTHPDVERMLGDLCLRMRETLGPELVGLYLYGSLVSGGFIPGVSDCDLLAAMQTDVDDGAFARLGALHRALAVDYPAWEGRFEIAYLSVAGLRTFRTQETRMAVISPGEPFHHKPAGKEWTINWWLVRERGLILYGPDPGRLIPSISRAEFLDQVRAHAHHWREWVHDARSRKGQSYARLTMCRALYAAVHGEQVSKQRAAAWVQQALPEHGVLIEEALLWRVAEGDGAADAAIRAATGQFVDLMIDQVDAVRRTDGGAHAGDV